VHTSELPNIPVDIDQDTYCAIDDRKFGHTVIIIDVSSALDQAQIDYIKGKVFEKSFYTQYPPFTKFSYLLIRNDAKPQSQEFIFSKCRPKSGTRTSYGEDDLHTNDENKIIVELTYEEFVNEAIATGDKLMSYYNASVPKEKEKSYIYETIAAVFDMPKFDFKSGITSGYKKGQRDIIIISDMMQHTKRLSFYSACREYGAFSSTVSKCPEYKKLIEKSSTKDYINATSPRDPSSSIRMYFLTHRHETTPELDTSLENLWRDYLKSKNFKRIIFERQLDIQ
tara:strand:- start:229 stop:1074 length:846 start_codon:yes stop_codon:yes gene_type:complete